MLSTTVDEAVSVLPMGRNTLAATPARYALTTALAVIVLLIALYLKSPLLALVAAAGIAGLLITIRHPVWAMSLLFASLPFEQPLFGKYAVVSLCASDVIAFLLLIALLKPLLQHRKLVIGPIALPLLIFCTVILSSAVIHYDGVPTLLAVSRALLMTAAAILVWTNFWTEGCEVKEMHRCLRAFLHGINLLSVICLLTYFSSGIEGAMYTLDINKNALGPTFGCGIVLTVCLLFSGSYHHASGRAKNWERIWLAATLLGASGGLFLTLSRSGWAATAAAILFVALTGRKVLQLAVAAVPIFILMALLWSHLPETQRVYAGDISFSAPNAVTRLDLMRKSVAAFYESPWFGNGVGVIKDVDPHNLIALTLSETGIVGLASFALLTGAGFWTLRRASRAAGMSRMAQPLLMAGAGILVLTLVDSMLDIYWRRGVGYMSWSIVGMGTALLSRSVHRQPFVDPLFTDAASQKGSVVSE